MCPCSIFFANEYGPYFFITSFKGSECPFDSTEVFISIVNDLRIGCRLGKIGFYDIAAVQLCRFLQGFFINAAFNSPVDSLVCYKCFQFDFLYEVGNVPKGYVYRGPGVLFEIHVLLQNAIKHRPHLLFAMPSDVLGSKRIPSADVSSGRLNLLDFGHVLIKQACLEEALIEELLNL